MEAGILRGRTVREIYKTKSRHYSSLEHSTKKREEDDESEGKRNNKKNQELISCRGKAIISSDSFTAPAVLKYLSFTTPISIA